MLVLEELNHARKRGAPILAELCGYGATADANHITLPAPGGAGGVRAAHMALEFVLLAQRGEHGHGNEAAGLAVQAVAMPHVAPGGAGNVVLDGLGERRGAAQRAVHKFIAHDLAARGQPALVLLVLHVCSV